MVTLQGIQRTFKAPGRDGAEVKAIDNVSLTIEEGQFFVLLGPSGCGKTTTLRAVAGLERPDQGTITIDGEVVFDGDRRIFVPPERRPCSMMFQMYALWPHMKVYQNIAFPLRHGVRRIPAAQIRDQVRAVAELLEIEELLDRPVVTLSGGQQQRVALARALALRPKVLLMDEPLSNLDAKLRLRLRSEIKKLTKSIGLTTLYVTHDQDEAISMGDRLGVMRSGRLLQVDTPERMYEAPQDLFVAQFLGETNVVKVRIAEVKGGEAKVLLSGRPLHARAGAGSGRDQEGLLCFRVRDTAVVDGESDPSVNTFQVRIVDKQYLGGGYGYEARLGESHIHFRSPVSLDVHSSVTVSAPISRCVVFPDTAGAEEAQSGDARMSRVS